MEGDHERLRTRDARLRPDQKIEYDPGAATRAIKSLHLEWDRPQ
jgi:hypothetical protein